MARQMNAAITPVTFMDAPPHFETACPYDLSNVAAKLRLQTAVVVL